MKETSVEQTTRKSASGQNDAGPHALPSWREVSLYFLMLGFINIGGPVAQITMMFNHMVERRRWLSKEDFVRVLAFCHMLPGPEALQLAIYVGYLKRGPFAGILAGLTFIVPGAALMIVLSWLYATYGSLPQVNDVLYILKPAVLGIIAAGIIKLGQAAIRSFALALLAAGAIAGMRFGGVNLLVILVVAGAINLLVAEGLPRLGRNAAGMVVAAVGIETGLSAPRLAQISWLALKTGLFSFGGAYASVAFLQRGAVDEHHWLTSGQLLDGVALSVATPGPFMLFTTFVGYIGGGVTGAILATLFVFLPSFVFVLCGARYVEHVSHNRVVQETLAGISAAVVGVIFAVSLDLAPEALVDWPTGVIAAAAFLIIVLLKKDVALVAVGAMIGGVARAAIKAFA
jgi:chromate transporter